MADEYVSTRSLIDKLDLKPMSRTSALGIEAEFFNQQPQARTSDVSHRLRKDSDVIFCAEEGEAALEKLKLLRDYIRQDGAIWAVSLKGRQAKIRHVQVIAAAKTAGLVDNKACRFRRRTRR